MCTVCAQWILAPPQRTAPRLDALLARLRGTQARRADWPVMNAREIAGVRLPVDQTSLAAMALAEAALLASLRNHSLRTFVLGMLDARRLGRMVDEEGAFVASMLHDLALSQEHSGDPLRTFEENGAEFVRAFAQGRGFSAARSDRMAQAILLHAGRAAGMGADVEFVMRGAAQDVFGPAPDEVSDAQIWAIESAIPRLGFRSAFIAALEDHVRRTRNAGWTAGFAADPPQAFLANRWTG